MLNKKIIILAIFIVSILAVSAVSAADNASDDVVGEEAVATSDTNVLNRNLEDSAQVIADDEDYYDDYEDYDDYDDYDDDEDWDDDDYDDYEYKKTVVLKKTMKVGKYKIKLTSKQLKALTKAAKKGKFKSIKVKTKYKYKVKVPYKKKVKKYKTLKTVKTFYGMYLQEFKKMRKNGWKLKSEKVFTKKNPKNKYGIGLSAYTYSISKWVKTYKKTKYKTKKYPVKAKLTVKRVYPSTIKVYAKGVTLYDYYLGVGQ